MATLKQPTRNADGRGEVRGLSRIQRRVPTKAKPKEPPVSVAVLQSGKASDFWAIICATIDQNIAALEEDLKSRKLEELAAAEYKVRTEVIKHQIRHLEQLRDTPENLLKSIAEEKEPEQEFDPYA